MKKGILIVIMLAMILLSGCAVNTLKEEGNENSGRTQSEEMIPVSFYSEEPFNLLNVNKFQAIKDKIYYTRISWNEDTERVESVLYRKSAEPGEPETEISDFREKELLEYLVDLDGNIYILYLETGSQMKIPYLKKISPSGEEIYCNSLEAQMEGNLWNYAEGGVVDDQGRPCFFSLQKEYFLFDEQGQFVKKGRAKWSKEGEGDLGEEGIVNAGPEGCYLFAIGKDQIYFQRLFMDMGTLGDEISTSYENDNISPALLNGYDNGILIAEDNSLWSFMPSMGKKEILVDFFSEHVNIIGNQTVKIGLPDNGEMIVFLYDYQQSLSEQATVRYLPKDQVKPKQLVRIALRQEGNEKIEGWVKQFNRQSMEYKVTLEELEEDYGKNEDLFEIYKDILNKDMADMIDISDLSVQELVSKGLVENLEPYFAQSSLVRKEDILANVWKAGMCMDGMYFVIPDFSIQSLVVKKEHLDGNTWSIGEFTTMVENLSVSRPLQNFGGWELIDFLLTADMDGYIDWQEKKADFQKESFISILELGRRIGPSLRDSDTSSMDYKEKFMSGQWFTYIYYINSITDYLEDRDSFGDQVVYAPYPNEKGVPWYPMDSNYALAVSSNSECKEGAWAFLEFLLGEKTQRKIRLFPSRKEVFEEKIRSTEISFYDGRQLIPDQEDIQQISYMVDNMYYSNNSLYSSVKTILMQEIIHYLNHGKSAEETAEIIQNRVQLLLNE